MKKWYAAVGILAVVLGISLGSCSIQMDQVERYEGKLADAEAELTAVKSDLRAAQGDLAELEDDYQKLLNEYSMLEDIKVMTFNNSLQVFGVSRTYYDIQGKVKNVSDKPIPHAIILIAFYHEDGSLYSVNEVGLTDLFPGETLEWDTYRPWVDGQAEVFDIYAIGNRGG